MKKGRAIWLGLLLSQAGEFGFVLFGAGGGARLITPEAASLFAAVVTLSMVSTPFLMRLIEWVFDRARGAARPTGSTGRNIRRKPTSIVVGYGRFGQTVAQMLMAKRIR